MSQALDHTLKYLSSPAAQASLQKNCYWPKWDSPWWHMLLLHEMGRARDIPPSALEALVESLDASPCKIFPIHPGELTVDPHLETHCHCALGCIYQVLAAAGVDVDARLPWIREWFLRYQMRDGGYTCANNAYLVEDECPSSMVGTIAVFEAVLNYTNRPYTEQESELLNRAAQFLRHRQLTQGSSTRYNAAEREAAPEWLQPCFPRFYFYDVLRGLSALTQWAEKFGVVLEPASYAAAQNHLEREFPDGTVLSQRQPWRDKESPVDGKWLPAPSFPLLEEVGRVGHANAYLSAEWQATRQRLLGGSSQHGLKQAQL
jgi:hypothetical protein